MRGLQEAMGLARAGRVRLRVLNVVDELSVVAGIESYAVATDLIDSLRASGQSALDTAAAIAEKARVKAECVLREGRNRAVSDAILDEAKKWRADVIVMGTHGRRGMNRLLLGSDAERVLRESPVPVLLVKDDKRRTWQKRRGRT